MKSTHFLRVDHDLRLRVRRGPGPFRAIFGMGEAGIGFFYKKGGFPGKTLRDLPENDCIFKQPVEGTIMGSAFESEDRPLTVPKGTNKEHSPLAVPGVLQANGQFRFRDCRQQTEQQQQSNACSTPILYRSRHLVLP